MYEKKHHILSFGVVSHDSWLFCADSAAISADVYTADHYSDAGDWRRACRSIRFQYLDKRLLFQAERIDRSKRDFSDLDQPGAYKA
jgi:hypothetical protein